MKTDVSQYIEYHKKKNEAYKRMLEEKRLNLIDISKEIGRMIGEKFHPEKIYLFGSVLSADLFETYSDLDIAIEGLSIEDFYKAHKIAEDLSPITVDFINFNRAEEFVKERIIRTGRVIYESK